MEERLVALLKSEGINPTRFAERIGVQRSSMSHILSGRNKPSFDFIVKILDSFPSVNPDWLLQGKGSMYRDDHPGQPGLFDAVEPVVVAPAGGSPVVPLSENPETAGTKGFKADRELAGQPGITALKPEKHGRSVEKIVIFYSDKTYKEYTPES